MIKRFGLLIVAQDLCRFGVVDLQPREQRSHGVAALDAFFAREGQFLGGDRRQRRQLQFLNHIVDGQFFNHSVWCDPERSHHSEARYRNKGRRQPMAERKIAYSGRNFMG